MSNHKNCYELVKEVRLGLNEYDDALARGDDTIGGFKNELIFQAINNSIRELYSLIARRRPDEFIGEESLTAVDSVITLPPQFSKLVLLRDQYGHALSEIADVQRRRPDDQGSTLLHYKRGKTIVIDRQGDTGTYGLVFKRRARDIHQGRALAGGTDAITLSALVASNLADIYNSMIIENVTAGWDSVITDYSVGRVATVTGNSTTGDFYALVPDLPEWSHVLIAPRAVLSIKNNPIAKEKVTKNEIEDYKELMLSLFRENATPSEDISYEEMFFRGEPKQHGRML